MITVEYSELPQLAGRDLGCSDWVEIDQTRIDMFADATGDHQWIHVDTEKAELLGRSTIAHGFLTLSLLPSLGEQLLHVENISQALNVGANRVRFITMVPAGARVRCHQAIADVTPRAGGMQVVANSTFELEGSERPAAIVESVALYLP